MDRVAWLAGKTIEHAVPAGWPDETFDIAEKYTWDMRCQKLVDAKETFVWWRGHVDAWEEASAYAPIAACPHEAYLAILRLGFSVDSIGGGTIVLVCPPVEAP